MTWLQKLLGKPASEKAAQRVAEGVALARSGALARALEVYRDAQRLDPGNAFAYLNEGLALQDLYNQQAADLAPDERLARLRDIREALERALDHDEGSWIAWRALGHVSRRLGRFVAAEAAFRRLLRDAPGDYPHRAEVERELLEVAPHAARQGALERAADLAIREDIEPELLREALEGLAVFLADESTPAEAFWAAGVLARRLEDAARAEEHFAACLARAPHHVNARQEMASLCMRAARLREALDHSLAAYREDPTNPALVCNVGVCWLLLGDLARAEEYVAMARDMAPQDAIVQRAWGQVREAASRAPHP